MEKDAIWLAASKLGELAASKLGESDEDMFYDEKKKHDTINLNSYNTQIYKIVSANHVLTDHNQDRIERYYGVKVLGRGGYNTVYEINDEYVLRLSSSDIIDNKSLSSSDIIDNKIIRNELNGLELQYEVNGCENIAKIYSYGTITYYIKEKNKKTLAYAIMDNLKGKDLFTYIYENKGDFDKPHDDEIKQIIYKILIALQCMYKKGFCHNDIKLENIMLKTKNNFSTVKLIDFGFMEKCPNPSDKTNLKGTPDYIHYKYITEKGKSPKVDMWALGITCLELLLGDRFKPDDIKPNSDINIIAPQYDKKYKYINEIYNNVIKKDFPEFEELLGLLLGIETISSKIEDVPFSKNVTHCLQRMIDSTCKLYDNPYTILLNLPIFDETRLAEKEDKKVKFKKTIKEIPNEPISKDIKKSMTQTVYEHKKAKIDQKKENCELIEDKIQYYCNKKDTLPYLSEENKEKIDTVVKQRKSKCEEYNDKFIDSNCDSFSGLGPLINDPYYNLNTVLEECASYINEKYKKYNLNFKPEELIDLIDYPNDKLNNNQMEIKLDVINCLNKHNLLSQGNGKNMSKRNRNKHTKRKSSKRKSSKRKSSKRKSSKRK
jgi:serine/threonine protein kinase